MVDNKEIRRRLNQLIHEHHDDDYSSVSSLLGKNHAYIQQFIKRGIPKHLRPEDRKILARHYGVSQEYLGATSGFSESTTPYSYPTNTLFIAYYDVQASAGMGALNEHDHIVGNLPFNRKQLRDLGCTEPDHLAVLKVDGDSMIPTLNHGDDILLDTRVESARKDGIYVLRNDGALLVKRVSVNPATGFVTVKSDNPLYESWENCPPDRIDLIGRVIWVGRKL
jgi:phage repressor protein C with HTH and peptisase S24 domain